MAEPWPRSERAPDDRAQLIRLIHRAQMMNHIHDALQSTLDEDSLCWIIVTTLVSHRGMGFSRALLFRHDSTDDAFHGCAAFGALSAPRQEALRKEIEAGELFDRAVSEPEGLELKWINEESLFQPSEDERNQPGFWTRLTQRYKDSNPLFDIVRSLAISEYDFLRDTDGGGRRFMRKLIRSRGCTFVAQAELQRASLPMALKEILRGDSLWSVIRTPKGARMVLIADKPFEDHPIDEIDQLHLDWFCGQVATTLEKVELLADLTKTNESLKVLDTLKSNFLSTVSHELRSPLTAITGFARLLANGQAGDISAKQRDLLNRVVNHGEKLTNIINDLIEIAEIDSGVAVDLKLEPIDPLNVLMSTLPKLQARQMGKAVAIEPVIRSTVPLIRADGRRLERIFYHLLDNAVKFSRENSKVFVKFIQDEGELVIKIVDTGIGIAPEKLNQIFESFFQIDSRIARSYEGMGIGLTLTSKLVAGTGGRLDVESTLGKGTTFTITYPILTQMEDLSGDSWPPPM